MKIPRASLFVLLPSLAAAWPEVPLPAVTLEPTPVTLLANALESAPPVNYFIVDPAPEVRVAYVSHMPVRLAPAGECDPKMVHPVDPAIDYQLTVLSPGVGNGK
jgi:hypothetical protein